MIIFNITVNISYSAEQEWVTYMKTIHIPEILASKLPLEVKFLRLLTEIENDGSTYTTQFAFLTMEDFLAYQTHFQTPLLEKHHQRFSGQYVSFRTLLEEV